jgi:hypothetical protein
MVTGERDTGPLTSILLAVVAQVVSMALTLALALVVGREGVKEPHIHHSRDARTQGHIQSIRTTKELTGLT